MSEWQSGIYEVEWQGKVGIGVGRLDMGLFPLSGVWENPLYIWGSVSHL